ncbi:GDSL-type esterase/lipase family protein [Kluyvera ascorbata]|uniref:cytidylyltransferase domain-containing protein n=1 Tax=Kluyvera ascorbata TaxID=51288 RepID=UPI002ABBA66F|nr:GDSL-type esterase/lipase family protein [Kluyvera ascorbata]MDZ4030836.1 GDSL-type esterase/lipase family protein [Kluyvera ascorbata]
MSVSPTKIAIIPARSGSKGLPNKNILMLVDKPLIAYTIEAAISSKIFDHIIVSTDSHEYANIAKSYGAEVMMRNDELSSDSASSFMVVKDVLDRCANCDYFVLLQPTSPFRNSQHIIEAVELFEKSNNAKFLVSVVESSKSSDLIKPIDHSLSLVNFEQDFSKYRRQNKKEYCPNGAIFIGNKVDYISQKHFFGEKSIAYIMSKEDSVDIDDQLDFEFAIVIQSKKNKKKILNSKIDARINEKKNQFNQLRTITLIGHSIFDYWNIRELNGELVNNLGIAGIDSEKYYKDILDKNKISVLGEYVLLLSGTNDIVNKNWTIDYTISWTKKIIDKLISINSKVKIILLSVPPVFGRIDRSNKVIAKLNAEMSNYFGNYEQVIWYHFSSSFYDEYGNLRKDYTNDGLHFNDKAYQQLEIDISEVIK